MTDRRYIKNTALLFAAMAVTKIVGAIFKIPLANVLGGTGMGYFSTAYGLYSPVFAVTAAGIPTVLMRLTAQNLAAGRTRNALKIKKTAMLIFTFIGLAGTLLIWLLSGYFAENIACSPESRAAVAAIAPAVLFCCIASVIRGYYEGQSNVLPTAAANVTEAVSRAVIGLALSYGIVAYAKFSFENGLPFFGEHYVSYEAAYSAALPYAAAAAIVAVTLSEVCGLLALLIHDRRHREKITLPDTLPLDGRRKISVNLIKELMPIAASALVMNCFSFADLLTVTRTIDGSIAADSEYYSRAFSGVIGSGVELDGLANFMYGSYTGIAMSLFMLVPSFAGMTEKTAIPEIAAAWEKKEEKTLASKASFLIRASAMIGFPACFGAAVMAEPILTMLYRSRAAEVSVCLDSFVVLCLGGMFMITASSLSGIFQSIGKSYIPLWLMCGAVAVKFILNPILIGIPEINISGAAISTVVSYILVSAAGVFIMKKYITDFKILRSIFPPMLGGVLCASAAGMVYQPLSEALAQPIAVVLSIFLGGIVYVLSLILTGFFRTKPIIKRKKPKKISKGVAK